MFDMLKMLYFWPLSQFTNWVIAEVGGDGRSQETSFCLVRSCSSPARRAEEAGSANQRPGLSPGDQSEAGAAPCHLLSLSMPG